VLPCSAGVNDTYAGFPQDLKIADAIAEEKKPGAGERGKEEV